MTQSVRPTKKQRELLDFIEAFIGEHGYSPSYREIMNGCNYSSVATVSLHVSNLIKRGHLQKRDHSARSLEVVRLPEEQLAEASVDQAHARWLVNKVEAYLRGTEVLEDSAVEETDHEANGQLLIDALRVLGLTAQADALQQQLAAVPVAAMAGEPVEV
jgi:SOS-response transcriptional repressor LexA